MKTLVGLDLGTINDYTAQAVVQKRTLEKDCNKITYYDVRYLRRHLGAPYTEITTKLQTIVEGLESPTIIVDATGVGRPVIDLMRERGLRGIVPVIITGGDSVTEDKVNGHVEYRVPKRDLVGSLQVLLQNRQLRIPNSIDLRDELVREMQNFKVKLNAETGHDSYEHWRASDHDDLVLAVALACWFGHRSGWKKPMAFSKSINRQVPPMNRGAMKNLLEQNRHFS